jgi:hypothetical protein
VNEIAAGLVDELRQAGIDSNLLQSGKLLAQMAAGSRTGNDERAGRSAYKGSGLQFPAKVWT